MVNPVKQYGGYASVIGDVVASKLHADRQGSRLLLNEALARANSSIRGIQPLEITIGDEFQGLFGRTDEALTAALLVRMHLLERVDVRFGIGWGPLDAFDEAEAPFRQDGPAWWAAREAIEGVARMAKQNERPRGARTSFRGSYGDNDRTPGTEQRSLPGLPMPKNLFAHPDGLIDAYLLCQDEIVAGMSRRDADIFLGLLDNKPLGEIAESLGVVKSAVSQRAHRSGAYTLRTALLELRTAFD
jgi:hypothetical protein